MNNHWLDAALQRRHPYFPLATIKQLLRYGFGHDHLPMLYSIKDELEIEFTNSLDPLFRIVSIGGAWMTVDHLMCYFDTFLDE